MRSRVGYLDSIRGLGALVVALDHFAHFYLPVVTTGEFATEILKKHLLLSPAMLIVDGDSAVCVFFVLSGYVLTPAFSSSIRVPGRVLMARFARLFIPGICACLFGYGLFLYSNICSLGWPVFWSGRSHLLVGHGWGSLLSFGKDALLNSTILGYQDVSIFSYIHGFSAFLTAADRSFNAPLWTLSIEAQGSVLILMLLLLRTRSLLLWRAAVVVSVLLLVRHWFICFVVGHLVAICAESDQLQHVKEVIHPLVRQCFALILLAVGIGLLLRAAGGYTFPFDWLNNENLRLIGVGDPEMIERLYACIFIFIGLNLYSEIHPSMEAAPLIWLGRLSFPIYLVHFPIIQFISPLISMRLTPYLPNAAAIFCIGLCVAFLVLICSVLFLRIDQLAIGLGKQIRASTRTHVSHDGSESLS